METHFIENARHDMSVFILAPRYVVFHARAEIRRSSSPRRDTFFFRSAIDIMARSKYT